MKYVLLLLLPIIFSSCLKNCIEGEGSIEAREFPVESNFTEVRLSSSFDINIIKGPALKIEASSHPNILDKLKLEISGNQLLVDMQSGNYCNMDMELNITMPSITNATLDGSGNIYIGQFNEDKFAAEIDGSGDIVFNNLTANKVTALINGSGNIDIVGITVSEDLSINGSGNIRTFNLNSSVSTALVEGSGNIELSASQILDATIEGSGNIYYRGNPIVTQYINGSGNIIKD